MAGFVIRRLIALVPLVLGISLVCFALMHATPGGPTAMLTQNPMVRPEDVARIRSNFGLDKPLIIQYVFWLKRAVVHADFGYSFVTGEPVLRMIARRLPATLELMGSALLMAALIGLPAGAVAALRRRSGFDALLTAASLAVISTPVFWLGLLSIMVFSVHLGWFPSGGRFTVGTPFSWADHLRHLALPSSVLALSLMAGWSRYTRESMRNVLESRYIAVARAKGLKETAVMWRHAARNAMPPVVAVISLSLPLLFTGSIIVETIFSWPGMGRLFYDGLLRQDYTRLMGVIFVASLLVALFNLLADVIHAILDPRTRQAG